MPYEYRAEMAQKSETYVLDGLMKNKAKHSNIMKVEHNYLGETFRGKVLLEGD